MRSPARAWAQFGLLVETLADFGLGDGGALLGHPAGDLAGDVAVGQTGVGEHLTAGCVRKELLGQPDIAAGNVDLRAAQGPENPGDTAAAIDDFLRERRRGRGSVS